MASVRLERLEKSFADGRRVVQGIDLTIDDGEFVTFVGPSGCGKTTLMNLIAGLERPTSGHVRIDERIVDDWSPKERNVAMVFQSYALYPHMTVAENIGFPLSVAGLPKSKIAEKVTALAERLGLAHELSKKPKSLSGGQRQRVALGRALVRDPRLCLFDEPLSNLDAALRAQMRGELKKLHEDLGATFIYVTHDQAEAMTLSSRVVVLAEGVVQHVAKPIDVYRRPANLFVAKFVGAPRINVAAPAVFGLEDEVRARVGDRDVWMGVRPEHVTIGEGEAPPSAPRGAVYTVEPMGNETWVTTTIGEDRLVARARPEFTARSGTPVWLAVDRSEALVFDRATEQRLDVRW